MQPEVTALIKPHNPDNNRASLLLTSYLSKRPSEVVVKNSQLSLKLASLKPLSRKLSRNQLHIRPKNSIMTFWRKNASLLTHEKEKLSSKERPIQIIRTQSRPLMITSFMSQTRAKSVEHFVKTRNHFLWEMSMDNRKLPLKQSLKDISKKSIEAALIKQGKELPLTVAQQPRNRRKINAMHDMQTRVRTTQKRRKRSVVQTHSINCNNEPHSGLTFTPIYPCVAVKQRKSSPDLHRRVDSHFPKPWQKEEVMANKCKTNKIEEQLYKISPVAIVIKTKEGVPIFY